MAAKEAVVGAVAVSDVSYDRVSKVSHVSSQLMQAARQRAQLQQGVAGRGVTAYAFRQLRFGHALEQRATCGTRFPLVGRQRVVDLAVALQPAAHDSDVCLLDVAVGPGRTERPGRLRAQPEDENAGGAAIEPVDRIDASPELVATQGQAVDAVRGPSRAVDDETARLVDDDDLVVGIEDR